MSPDLHTAALRGDWKFAKSYGGDLGQEITDKKETALHIAVIAQKVHFVENLVNHIREMDHSGKKTQRFLEMENINRNTALCYAATTGIVRIAEVMVDAYDEGCARKYTLLNRGQIKPLLMAAWLGHCEMVKYLCPKTDLNDWSKKDRFELCTNFIVIGLCDESLNLLGEYPELGTYRDENDDTALHILARQPSAFVREKQPYWRRFIGLCEKARDNGNAKSHAVNLVKELHRHALSNCDLEKTINPTTPIAQALLIAAEKGNIEFLIVLLRLDPNLMWKVEKEKGSIFHIAIRNRHESIFNFLFELGSIKDLVAADVIGSEKNENMLHLAAKLAPQAQLNIVSGAALQMQLELLWFKEVEKMVQPSQRDMVNSEGKTPQMLFSEEHKDLMQAGEKWMKDTANSSMVVATLIATVMFTTAFTVPGGYNSSSGQPIFEKDRSFFIFSLADAVALFSSSTSILMFHSIITSRYAENDFLESLPFRLMVGVTSLFISVAAMMVAFCATFLLYYPHDVWPWSFALFGLFACVPSLYVSLKYPLLLDLIHSTYDSRFMFRSEKRLF